MPKRLRRNTWYYYTTVPGQPRIQRTLKTSDPVVAQRKADRLDAHFAKVRAEARTQALTLNRAAALWIDHLDSEVADSVRERARYSLDAFIAWAGPTRLAATIDTETLDQYQIARLKSGSSLDTIARDMSNITRMLKHHSLAVERPDKRYPKDRTGKTKHRPFTDDELVRFFAHATPRHKPLWALLLTTGARPTELIPSARSRHQPLLKSECDLEQDRVFLRQGKNRVGHDKDPRGWIPIPEDVVALLRWQILQTPPDHPYVFEPVSNLARAFDHTLARANIEKTDVLGRSLVAHSFRHTFATKMGAVCQNAFMLRIAMGWASSRVADRYIHGGSGSEPTITLPGINMCIPACQREPAREQGCNGRNRGDSAPQSPSRIRRVPHGLCRVSCVTPCVTRCGIGLYLTW